jgi:hypothetical protein
VSSGQPSVENGHRPDENHVSSTSGSRRTGPPQSGQLVTSVRATWMEPSRSQYQAGIWWPHQSCREMGQGRMFSIQWKYVFVHPRGMILIFPARTALIASWASGLTLTYHCFETSGSTTVLHR